MGPDRTFVLSAAYGMSQPNTTEIRDGGTKVDMVGTWSTSVGTSSDPHATVIELSDPEHAAHSILFVQISDDLLHLLDPQKRLMIGHGGWSYTLNRTGPATTRAEFGGDPSSRAPAPDTTTTPFEPVGAYVGRTPCSEIINKFTTVPADPNCRRIKWLLHINAADRNPTTGTYIFDGTETRREGTWRLVDGTPSHPTAMILELDLGDGDQLWLLQAAANNLYVLDRDGEPTVGDAILSYTLSRAVVVHLDIFSGRESPTWLLTTEEARRLESASDALPSRASSGEHLPDGLGFQGFHVTGLPIHADRKAVLDVHEDSATLREPDGTKTLLIDEQRSLLALLIELAVSYDPELEPILPQGYDDGG